MLLHCGAARLPKTPGRKACLTSLVSTAQLLTLLQSLFLSDTMTIQIDCLDPEPMCLEDAMAYEFFMEQRKQFLL